MRNTKGMKLQEYVQKMSKMGTYLEYERKKCSGNDTGISLNKMVTEFEQKFLCEHDEQKRQNQEKGGEIQMYKEINRKNKRIWLKIGGIELKKTEREEMILKVFCEVIQLQKTKEIRIM